MQLSTSSVPSERGFNLLSMPGAHCGAAPQPALAAPGATTTEFSELFPPDLKKALVGDATAALAVPGWLIGSPVASLQPRPGTAVVAHPTDEGCQALRGDMMSAPTLEADEALQEQRGAFPSESPGDKAEYNRTRRDVSLRLVNTGSRAPDGREPRNILREGRPSQDVDDPAIAQPVAAAIPLLGAPSDRDVVFVAVTAGDSTTGARRSADAIGSSAVRSESPSAMPTSPATLISTDRAVPLISPATEYTHAFPSLGLIGDAGQGTSRSPFPSGDTMSATVANVAASSAEAVEKREGPVMPVGIRNPLGPVAPASDRRSAPLARRFANRDSIPAAPSPEELPVAERLGRPEVRCLPEDLTGTDEGSSRSVPAVETEEEAGEPLPAASQEALPTLAGFSEGSNDCVFRPAEPHVHLATSERSAAEVQDRALKLPRPVRARESLPREVSSFSRGPIRPDRNSQTESNSIRAIRDIPHEGVSPEAPTDRLPVTEELLSPTMFTTRQVSPTANEVAEREWSHGRATPSAAAALSDVQPDSDASQQAAAQPGKAVPQHADSTTVFDIAAPAENRAVEWKDVASADIPAVFRSSDQPAAAVASTEPVHNRPAAVAVQTAEARPLPAAEPRVPTMDIASDKGGDGGPVPAPSAPGNASMPPAPSVPSHPENRFTPMPVPARAERDAPGQSIVTTPTFGYNVEGNDAAESSRSAAADGIASPPHAVRPGPARFAAAPEAASAGPGSAHHDATKNALDTVKAEVAQDEKPVGIRIADTVPAMRFGRFSLQSFGQDFQPPILPESGFAGTVVAEPATATPDADVHLVETAHRAVEATLHAIDLLARPGHPALKLEISVGGEHLIVHVERKAGEIRTVFHTDSPDLQAALSHEWQFVVAPGSERSLRLADPQFVGLGGMASGDSSDAFADGRRHAGRTRLEDGDFTTGRVRSSAAASTGAAPVANPTAGTSIHLHTKA